MLYFFHRNLTTYNIVCDHYYFYCTQGSAKLHIISKFGSTRSLFFISATLQCIVFWINFKFKGSEGICKSVGFGDYRHFVSVDNMRDLGGCVRSTLVTVHFAISDPLLLFALSYILHASVVVLQYLT